jgi:predicted HTH transcriptional regulator
VNDCMPFEGCINTKGYGVIQVAGKQVKAHRLAYCESKGIPLSEIEGQVIRHQCDSPNCVNPNHLLAGSQRENIMDRDSRGRQAKGAAHGVSKLTEDAVSKMRAIYFTQTISQRELAEMFGISQPQVSRVINGTYWK